MTPPTPRPWQYGPQHDGDGWIVINASGQLGIAWIVSEPDAALIMQAVNEYDALRAQAARLEHLESHGALGEDAMLRLLAERDAQAEQLAALDTLVQACREWAAISNSSQFESMVAYPGWATEYHLLEAIRTALQAIPPREGDPDE